jgi:cytoskeleton protein RodZ
LPSFGQKLKTEREKRAITLDQISSVTKIGTRMLKALEEDNFDQLPGGVFNKGFVRAYAHHVGLDEDQTVADYLQASGEVLPAPDPKLALPIPPPQPHYAPSRQVPWGFLAGAILLLALAVWIWSRLHRPLEQEIAPSTTAQKITLPIANTDATVPIVPAANVLDPMAKPAAKPTNLTPQSTVPVAAVAGDFTVVIVAREDSWLSIATDGKPAVEETLAGENQHALHARNRLVIKAGNIGAIDLVFEGKKLPSQGDYGEVKTLTFGPAGLQPNAPAQPPNSQ